MWGTNHGAQRFKHLAISKKHVATLLFLKDTESGLLKKNLLTANIFGRGSKSCTPGEHQNRWDMGVHPPQKWRRRF